MVGENNESCEIILNPVHRRKVFHHDDQAAGSDQIQRHGDHEQCGVTHPLLDFIVPTLLQLDDFAVWFV